MLVCHTVTQAQRSLLRLQTHRLHLFVCVSVCVCVCVCGCVCVCQTTYVYGHISLKFNELHIDTPV